MNIEKIKNANTKVLGKNIVFYKEIDSTQDEIRKMAEIMKGKSSSCLNLKSYYKKRIVFEGKNNKLTYFKL